MAELLVEMDTVKVGIPVVLTLPLVEVLPEAVGMAVPLSGEPEPVLLAKAVGERVGLGHTRRRLTWR